MSEERLKIESEALELLIKAKLFNHLAKCFTQDHQSFLSNLKSISRILEHIGELRLRDKVLEMINLLESNPGLTDDYSRIFESGNVSPYESDYIYDVRSPSKLYLKADVSGFYRALGMRSGGEMPDHISVELEFVSFTLLKEAYSLLKSDGKSGLVRDLRRKFLDEHLSRWLGKLDGRLRSHTDNKLYIDLVGLTIESIRRLL